MFYNIVPFTCSHTPRLPNTSHAELLFPSLSLPISIRLIAGAPKSFSFSSDHRNSFLRSPGRALRQLETNALSSGPHPRCLQAGADPHLAPPLSASQTVCSRQFQQRVINSTTAAVFLLVWSKAGSTHLTLQLLGQNPLCRKPDQWARSWQPTNSCQTRAW